MCSSGPREQRQIRRGRERGIAQETQDLLQNDGQTERSAKENKRGKEKEGRIWKKHRERRGGDNEEKSHMVGEVKNKKKYI